MDMQVTKISNITFKENVLSREMDSHDAILMLRDPNASIKFEHNKEMAQNADSLSSNPFKALGYKLYRTFNMLKENEPAQQTVETKHLNAVA